MVDELCSRFRSKQVLTIVKVQQNAFLGGINKNKPKINRVGSNGIGIIFYCPTCECLLFEKKKGKRREHIL